MTWPFSQATGEEKSENTKLLEAQPRFESLFADVVITQYTLLAATVSVLFPLSSFL